MHILAPPAPKAYACRPSSSIHRDAIGILDAEGLARAQVCTIDISLMIPTIIRLSLEILSYIWVAPR